MQEPEPFPPSDPSQATNARSAAPPAPATGWDGNDSPTVRTGSSARRARAIDGAVVALPRAGDRIDSFELEEAIGVGGMGAVFRALDTRLDRHIALKILPPEQASDAEVVQRFYQEGRAAARLDNENIARVYTIGHDAKYHYIAFEYIEGTTIRQRVERNGPLPVGEAINFTLQIAGALVHAAERGVVHRDIKPSNIIVTPQGRAKLVDMGLARRFERGGDDGLTQSGMTLGTFDYISPEQARDPRDVDVRSDLYSLGCTLFHMLTGRPPFPEGTVLQKLLQHQEDAPPDVRALNPEVPPDLATILVKLMAKDRDRRYQTPEQLVRDLLTVAGALGLRSVSPEGLVWMSATHPVGWERHLVWGVPSVALAAVVAGLVWWGQDTNNASPRGFPEAFPKITVRPANPRLDESPRVVASPPVAERSSSSAASPATRAAPAAVPRDILVESGDDLLAILATAPPRSIVVLTDDGPFEVGGGRAAARVLDRDLTVKAGAGVRPVLRLARDAGAAGRPPSAVLDLVGGRITLEGLEFLLEPGERAETLAAVRAENTELTVRRCEFRRRGARARRGRLAALAVRANPDPAAERASAVVADACHFDGGQVGVLVQGPADLLLRDCTIGGAEPAVWIEDTTPAPAELRLRHDSLLAGDGPVFRFDGTAPRVRIDDSVIAPARDVESTLVAADKPEGLDWRGRGNVYARVGVFLQPTGAAPRRGAVRDWASWEDALADVRESGSVSTAMRVWDESDPGATLGQENANPSRVFRLAATHPGSVDLGARQGPYGLLVPLAKMAAAAPPPRRSTEPSGPAPQPVPLPTEVAAGPPPMPMATTATSPTEAASAKAQTDSEMPEMPVMPPMEREGSPAQPTGAAEPKTGTETTAASPTVPNTPKVTAPEPADAAVLRTADQFLKALSDPQAQGGTLRLAADADWELAGAAIRGDVRWVLRAEAGPSRPRIRFRPDPADPKMPTAWSTWIDLRSGALKLEGIDILLARADAPRQGRWAAFGVRGGADLGLIGCTVTVEGDQVPSAAVVVLPGVEEVEVGAAGAEPSAAVVKLSDSLLRCGGDLVDVAGGRLLDLELNNAVVATEGSLVHAHGRSRGQLVEPVQLTLNQVTARTAGGLVQLESTPGEPDLPVADVRVRDAILATTPQGSPLFRVDGQDTLTALRDRIKWEGHGVAYHQINAYRRDQSAQVGAVPNIYDRPSWMVAIGTKEAAPVHGDVRFLRDWAPTRHPWTLRRDDVRLAPESPASRAGADLARIPDRAADPS